MKIAYFDCFSGISGDMILGALADLGIELSFFQKELKKLNLQGGYSLSYRKLKRGIIETTKVDVKVTDQSPAERNLKDICQIIEKSSLSENIQEDSIKIFQRLAKAEAAVHGGSIDQVHFHEVGAIDSIIDIVGSVIGLHHFKISKIISSPINTGSGFVKCDHGTLPVPAPAVLELLKGFPCFSSGHKQELATPTGVAIITTMAEIFGPMPNLIVDNSGYGAGNAELEDLPNALRIILGNSLTPTKEELFILETNIDDMNPEFYELAMEKLFAAGAADVFLTPIIMKKNRPATKLSLLTPQKNIELMANIILENTTSYGIRFHPVQRIMLERELQKIETSLGNVDVKIGKREGKIFHVSPEYERCKEISKEKNMPIKKVYEEIQTAISKAFNI